MSTKYKTSRDVPTEAIIARLKELSDAVTGGRESQEREFTMRIPAECDRDADLVIAEAARRLEQAQARADNCEREARQWRQEARTQAAIVAEIYQELTGRTGEPGDWNGARPLTPAILRKQAEAVEHARNEICNRSGYPSWHSIELTDYAQRLRQQADELEQRDGRS